MIKVMARIYADLIRKGMKTIDDLPNISGLKEAVEELLAKQKIKGAYK